MHNSRILTALRHLATRLTRTNEKIQFSKFRSYGNQLSVKPILPKANFFHTTIPPNKYKTDPLSPSSHTTKKGATTEQNASTTAKTQLAPGDQQQPPTQELPAKSRLFIAFTCKVCLHRSAKTMSREAYYHGVVIIQCSQCQNRHLIADHLGWFRDSRVTIEDLMLEQGEKVTKFVDASRSDVLEWGPDILEEEKKFKEAKKASKRHSGQNKEE